MVAITLVPVSAISEIKIAGSPRLRRTMVGRLWPKATSATVIRAVRLAV